MPNPLPDFGGTLPELDDKMKVWAEEYLTNGFNGAAAAKFAKYSSPKQAAHRLKSRPDVRAYLDARLQAMAMSADEVLGALTEMAHASLDDFIGTDDNIDLKRARKEKKLHLLKSYTVTTRTLKTIRKQDETVQEIERTVKIEIHDPQSALVQLGRAHKLFTDKHELSGSDGKPIPIKEIIIKKSKVDDE